MSHDLAPYAFLFKADDPAFGWSYGDPCDAAVVGALLRCAMGSAVSTRFSHGDVLVTAIAERVTEVGVETETLKHSQGRTYETIRIDRRRLLTLLWDLCDSLTAGWHSLDEDSLPMELGGKNVYAVVCPTLRSDLALQANDYLHDAAAYLGCASLDPGNPMHRILFKEYLMDAPFCLLDGTLCFSTSEDSPNPESWAGSLGGTEVKRLEEASWDETAPAKGWPLVRSQRGEETSALMKQLLVPSERERIVQALRRGDLLKPETGALTFHVATESADEVIIPRAKLVEYALNPDNPKAGGKAHLFKALLGFEAHNWAMLASQIADNVRTAVLQKVRVSEFGIQYHADVPVRGLNGQARLVRTAWIATRDGALRLVTAFVAPHGCQTDEQPATPSAFVPEQLQGAERWARLWELAVAAGKVAASRALPTPMYLRGYGWEPEGLCGVAWIVVPDARRGMARWLRQHDIGYPNDPSGQRVYADTDSQSRDRAVAFAQAAARVLRANGVECLVHTRLT